MIPSNVPIHFHLAHPDIRVVRKAVEAMRAWSDYTDWQAYNGETRAEWLGLSDLVGPSTPTLLVELPASTHAHAVQWLSTGPVPTAYFGARRLITLGWSFRCPGAELVGDACLLNGYFQEVYLNRKMDTDWAVAIVTGQCVTLVRLDGKFLMQTGFAEGLVEKDRRVHRIYRIQRYRGKFGEWDGSAQLTDLFERPGPGCRKFVCMAVFLPSVISGETRSAVDAA